MSVTMFMAAVNPNDGTTATCTTASGATTQIDNPGAGIPIIGGWLNNAGNAASNSNCVPDNGSSIPGMIKSAAATLKGPGAVVSDGNNHAAGVTAFLHNQTVQLTLITMVVAIGVMGARIALTQGKRGSFEGLAALMVGYVVTAGAGAGFIGLLVAGLNTMGGQILDNSGGGDWEKAMNDMIGNVPMGLGEIPAIAFGLLTWFAMALQWLVLHAINGLLPVLVGLWPLAFAVHGLWHPLAFKNRLTPLILTMATYPFVAMCIYAGGFSQITASGQPGGPSAWDGVILLILAVAAFPVIYKIVAPWVGAAPLTGLSAAGIGSAAAMAAIRV